MAEQTPEANEERIESGIEGRVQEEMAQGAGVARGESWEETARRIEAKIRTELAGVAGARPSASWAEVGQGLEARTKESLGRWAGATAQDDWDTVGRKIEGRIRDSAARWSGVEAGQPADWDTIARQSERRIRDGLARSVGAAPGSDWRTVGQQMENRVRIGLAEVFGERRREAGAAAGEPCGPAGEENVRTEEYHVSGSELLDKFKQLVHEGNVRKVMIRQGNNVLVEFPLTLGIVGVVLAPTLAAVGAMAALVADCTIVVEREA